VLASLLLMSAAAFVPSFAHAEPAALVVQNAWARKPPGADTAAVYFVLTNQSAKPVTVVGATSTLATHVMMHESSIVDGQSRMRMRDKVTIAPGKAVAFAPEGLHVMLSGFKYDVIVGDTMHVTLQLQDGGRVDVAALVRPLGAQ
jgi:copper(I)-binding protein